MPDNADTGAPKGRWLSLVQPKVQKYLGGTHELHMIYYYGLGEGRGSKRHIGPSDWCDDNRWGQAFCGRIMVGAEPWARLPSEVRGEGWCVRCTRALQALEEEVDRSNRATLQHNDG